MCVIYQLNFTIFLYITRISRYITLYKRSVLSAVSRNCGGSWKVLPADMEGPPVPGFILQGVMIKEAER